MYTDVITRIKNAQQAEKKMLKIRFTKMDYAVLQVLERYGFVKKTEIKGRAPKRIIDIDLNPDRPIQGTRFLSTPSRRLYAPVKNIRRVKGGYGIAVLSTPKGILSDTQAKKQNVGGQLLFEIW